MAQERQIPLDQLLFGSKAKPMATAESPLAAAFSDWFRDEAAKALRGRAGQRSSTPQVGDAKDGSGGQAANHDLR